MDKSAKKLVRSAEGIWTGAHAHCVLNRLPQEFDIELQLGSDGASLTGRLRDRNSMRAAPIVGVQDGLVVSFTANYAASDAVGGIAAVMFEGCLSMCGDSIIGRWEFKSGFFVGRSGPWQAFRAGSSLAAENLWPRLQTGS